MVKASTRWLIEGFAMAARASRGDSVVQRLPGKLALLKPGWLEKDVEATRVSGGCCTVKLEAQE